MLRKMGRSIASLRRLAAIGVVSWGRRRLDLQGTRRTNHHASKSPLVGTNSTKWAKDDKYCRAKRVVVSIADIFLCAVAIKQQWAIFTTDPDFSNYAKFFPFVSTRSKIVSSPNNSL
jgi:predicted nucleic acid-binding protein